MFGTIAGFRAWHAERGNVSPTEATNSDALAALVRASDYIQAAYVGRFDSKYKDPLPDAVEVAAYIAAGYELAQPGHFATSATAGQSKVLTKLDVMQWTVSEGGEQTYLAGGMKLDHQIDMLLSPFFAASAKAEAKDRSGRFGAFFGVVG